MAKRRFGNWKNEIGVRALARIKNTIVILNLFRDLSYIRLDVDLWQNLNVTDDRFQNKFGMTIIITIQ